MKRYELRNMQYHKNRYMQNISSDKIDQRFRDMNMVDLIKIYHIPITKQSHQ